LGRLRVSTPHLVTRFIGLYGSANPYAVAPEGAMAQADNCVIRAQQVLSSRRGHLALQYAPSVRAIGWKDGYMLLLGHDDIARGITGALKAVKGLVGDPFAVPAMQASLPMKPGGFPFASPGGAGGFTRFVQANKAAFFQSRYGLTKIESIPAGASVTGASRAAIQPPPSVCGFGDAQPDNSLAIAWLKDGFQVAYRFTICRLGANRELIESEPSDRLIIANTGGGSDSGVLITFSNSYMMPPDSFFRIYRTQQIAAGTDPGEEMKLVAEVLPDASSPDANGYCRVGATVLFRDQTPDQVLAVPLYTSPLSGHGIASANTSAPISADMALFKNRLLLLNTRDVERLTIRIIGTGTGGIVSGDTITIAGVKFTFRTGVATSGGVVKLITSGTVAQNIEGTARELTRALNLVFQASGLPLTSIVYARYISITASDAGQILLQRLIPGADPITIRTSSANGWDSDYTSATISSPDAQIAGLSWSPPNQPEAVPLENSTIVGDASAAGQRIIALKEAALAFKEDGLWRWTDDGSGSNDGVAITIADPTVRLLAPETAQAVDNFVLGLCDQGVLAFSEQGQRVDLSYDQVNQELQKLIANVGQDTLAKVAFAVAYQPEHEYLLCLPESPNATSCTLQYVFNLQTKGWTRWKLPGVVAGSVSPTTGQVVWVFETTSRAPGAAGNVWIERKAFDQTDFQDPGFSIAAPAAIVGTTVAQMTFVGDLTSGPNAFAVGDVVQQRQATYFLSQRVKAVQYMSAADRTIVTLDASPRRAWDATALLVLKAIQCTPKFLPWPGALEAIATAKQWGGVFLVFRYLGLDWITCQWSSEVERPDGVLEVVAGTSTTVPVKLDAFGSAPFGEASFDRQARNKIIKTTLPPAVLNAALLGLQLTFACALQPWELCAIDAKDESTSPDPVR
jgi:hypothetical protein